MKTHNAAPECATRRGSLRARGTQGGHRRGRREGLRASPLTCAARFCSKTPCQLARGAALVQAGSGEYAALTVYVQQQVHPHLIHLVAHVEHLGAALQAGVCPLQIGAE